MCSCVRYGSFSSLGSFTYNMSLLDYIIIALIAIWVVLSVVYIIRCKKKGKCIGCDESCNRDCKSCKIKDKKSEN